MKNKIPTITIGLDLGDKKHAICEPSLLVVDLLTKSILRKRRGGKGRGRGQDHHRWPNRYFTGLGLFCLLDAKVTETASLRHGANH